ncbi:hypothetical protein BU16DRAFT_534909 [Lophium mytilinum]|uniref:Uncharacterized protein n=1 Tax=Lophium mytilinum TaxID=390894 RepID=A0A6A6R6B3_9PEZI|nr:hypothetical protein BU16DRAFT_534909 [Lophium mytilinum]
MHVEVYSTNEEPRVDEDETKQGSTTRPASLSTTLSTNPRVEDASVASSAGAKSPLESRESGSGDGAYLPVLPGEDPIAVLERSIQGLYEHAKLHRKRGGDTEDRGRSTRKKRRQSKPKKESSAQPANKSLSKPLSLNSARVKDDKGRSGAHRIGVNVEKGNCVGVQNEQE